MSENFISKIDKNITIYFPMLCVIIMIIHSIFDFYEIYLRIFSYIGGTSLLVWIYLLWHSYLYKLCIHQKMFIYYLIFGNCIAIYDDYIGIPINDLNYLLVYCISFGITILIYGYFKYKENKNLNMKKKDSIQISEKHGLNPSLLKCICCGKEYGIAVLGKLKNDAEAPKYIYQGLCTNCERVINSGGTMIIEIKDGEKGVNPFRTGRIVGVSKDYKEKCNIDDSIIYMEESMFSNIFKNVEFEK